MTQKSIDGVASLQGAGVLITGAAGAIGSATAKLFAERGARLALVDRDVEALQRLEAELGNETSLHKSFGVDLLNDSELEALPNRVIEEFGEIDVFVSSAGIEMVSYLNAMSVHEIDVQLAMHLRIPILLSNFFLSSMLERRRGHIVIVSSMQGKLPTGGKAPYAAAKSGSIGFANSLRRELEGTGVAVSAVMPGFVSGAGQGVRGIEGSSVKLEQIGGSVTPEQCGRAILKCVDQRLPEVMVVRGNPKVMVASNAIWPRYADRLLKRIGAFDFWARVARDKGRNK